MRRLSSWGGIAPALIFGLWASMSGAAESGKPSFDCAKAKSVAETMICADPSLAAADAAIAANYASAMKRLDAPARKALAQDQEDFVSYRDRIAGFVGSWKNVAGDVTIKSAGSGKLEIEADTANPSTGGSECNVGGTVKAQNVLVLVDTDDNGKATGLVYRFRRVGDALEAEESGEARGDPTEPASCGANGHVSGTFFLTRLKS